jgi:hypothetical protein
MMGSAAKPALLCYVIVAAIEPRLAVFVPVCCPFAARQGDLERRDVGETVPSGS